MKKVAVVTGATSGIGRAVAELLLKEGIDVVALGRDIEKIKELKASFKHLTKDARLDVVLGDLSDKRQTKKAAVDLISCLNDNYGGKIDTICYVAGVVSSGYHENSDGNEITFAVNHLSIFALTHYLMPLLSEAKKPRILVVSSLAHYRATFNSKNIQSKKFYNIMKAYKATKLYNVLFVKEFARKYKNISIYAIDPGLVNTELGLKRTNWLAYYIWNIKRKKGTNASYPAKFMVDIATKQRYSMSTGAYFKEGIEIKSSKGSYSSKDAKTLWMISEKLTEIKY